MVGHKSAFLTLVAILLIAWLAAPALGFAPENYTQGGVMWAFVEGILKVAAFQYADCSHHRSENVFYRDEKRRSDVQKRERPLLVQQIYAYIRVTDKRSP